MKKKQYGAGTLLLVLALLWSGCGGPAPDDGAVPDAAQETETAEETEEIMTETVEEEEETMTLREELWAEYCERERQGETRIREDEDRSVSLNGVVMKYGMKIVGEPDEEGRYPLYIALHGGGSDETGRINDDQWRQMGTYYLGGVKSGIYVNPRAVRDTWDCHSNPESYPLYDRIIENMILFRNADPDRVYLMGFSAGGDGVYQITPRMTDRFAAANMSAGHPNGVKLENLYNMPLQLQVGANDDAYGRNKMTAEYDILLNKLQDKYGGGYIHRTNIHADRGHNFADYDDAEHEIMGDVRAFFRTGKSDTVKEKTGAVLFMDQYRRDPLPETVVWNLGVRASMRTAESFYWLSAPANVNTGIVTARFDREANSFIITTDGKVKGDLSVLLSEDMADFSRPVTVELDGETFSYEPQIRREVMEATLEERGDPRWIFSDRISLSELKDGAGD